jgi:hypothetical protein
LANFSQIFDIFVDFLTFWQNYQEYSNPILLWDLSAQIQETAAPLGLSCISLFIVGEKYVNTGTVK